MPVCPTCHHFTTMRHGHDRASHQQFLCKNCRRPLTADSATAFAGQHWPAEVIGFAQNVHCDANRRTAPRLAFLPPTPHLHATGTFWAKPR
jgi:transposase-like protein